MTSSKNLIFGSVFGLILIFGGTFVLLENDKQTQNNSEYISHTNNTGANTLPVISSETQVSELSQSGESLSGTKNTQTQSGFVFHAPNTEWKARTITLNDGRVVTYRFGEGNPEEVAVPTSKIDDFYTCKPPYEDRLQSGACPETQYLTPYIENALKTVLKNPLWGKVINECRESFRETKNIEKFDFSLRALIDINNILTIDVQSGRKQLNGLYELANLIDPSGSVDGVSEKFTQTECYKNRLILTTMINNIISAYNTGLFNETHSLGSIKNQLNQNLPNEYLLFQ